MAKTTSLFPILQPPPLTGIAAAAARAPLHSTGCLTEYRPLASKSILNKTASRRGLPGAPHLEEMWEGSGIMIVRVPYISKRCGREAPGALHLEEMWEGSGI